MFHFRSFVEIGRLHSTKFGDSLVYNSRYFLALIFIPLEEDFS